MALSEGSHENASRGKFEGGAMVERKEAHQYMWSSEMTKKINDSYESLLNRMQAVIAAHGGNISY
ncbi:hypothetical protein EON65_57810 [archaeon]|nr:MAG: hypothetical protein EON65_57810 [archaeon]